jgi:acetolactate synthase-1/3 small subunit
VKHTLSILVENKPGVLTRVAGLFARRGFNIESLAVGLSEDPRLSRITIVIDGDEHPVDQVTKQLHKLINVLKIRDLDPKNQVSAELLLVRVAGEGEKRTEALQIAEIFNAKIVDVDRRQLTLRVVGTNDKLEALLELLLVRVAGEGEKRSEALQIAEIFNAKIVDVDRRSVTLRVVGANDKLEALLELLQPLGVLEVVRTGTIAMGRGRG